MREQDQLKITSSLRDKSTRSISEMRTSFVLVALATTIQVCNACLVHRSEKWLVRGWVKFVPALD